MSEMNNRDKVLLAEKPFVNKILGLIINESISYVDKREGIFGVSATGNDGEYEFYFCNNRKCKNNFLNYNDIVKSISKSGLNLEDCDIGIFENCGGIIKVSYEEEKPKFYVSNRSTSAYFIKIDEEEIINTTYRKVKTESTYIVVDGELNKQDFLQTSNDYKVFMKK